jgi:4-hydroxy-tetrahydrodipicolinate reductase
VTRVGVVGAAGRMGATVCAAVAAAEDLELVAAVDPAGGGQQGLDVAAELDALVGSGAQVVVDFTVAPAARANLPWYADHGLHAVVGTSGLDEADLGAIGRAYPPTGALGCVVAANFAIGAVLLMRFAELAAPWFDTAEIVELHHDAKADAPSGTAVATAERMAAASADWAPDPTRTETIPGGRGAAGPGGIRIHSVRLRGLVAHQEVLLGTVGQTLTLRHDSYDRGSFMPGVLLAVRAVAARPGLTVGLDALLGL